MQKIFSSTQIQALDDATISEEGITSLDLMERAAQKATDALLRLYPQARHFALFAGPGKNGGDALAMARLIAASGRECQIEAWLFNTSGHLHADCQANKQRLESLSTVKFYEVTDRFEPPTLTADTVVVDGLFGIGLSRPLSGGFASLVNFINASPARVVSIDMPSGIPADEATSGNRLLSVQAHHTLTFHSLKRTMMLPDLAERFGQIEILDIGLSHSKADDIQTEWHIFSPADIARQSGVLTPRQPFSHKGTYGHALIIAGSYGMGGAATLAARACLRTGAGKVSVHTPLMNNDLIQIAVPEATLSHDASDTVFTAPPDVAPYQAVAVGPGIGTSRSTGTALFKLLTATSRPMVIDADAINLLSAHSAWLGQIPEHSILTPHPGEMARLSPGATTSGSLLEAAIRLASAHNIYIVLKGHHTAICTPEGHVWFNATGNPGMATAGSGDVLTGIITGLLAQGFSPQHAAMLGVCLHGLAGDLAAESLGQMSLIASDLIDYLPRAFSQLAEVAVQP